MNDAVNFINQHLKKRNCPLITEDDLVDENEFGFEWKCDEILDPNQLETQIQAEEEEAAMRQAEREAANSNEADHIDYTSLIDKTAKEEETLTELEEEAQKEAREVKESFVPARRWTFPKNRAKLETQFLNAYFEYIQTGHIQETRTLDDGTTRTVNMNDPKGYLLDLLGQLFTYRVFLRIRNLPVYTLGDEEDVTQTAQISALTAIERDLAAGRIYVLSKSAENPKMVESLSHQKDEAYKKLVLGYFASIYKNKAKDYMRYYGLISRKPANRQAQPENISKIPEDSDKYLEALVMDLDEDTAASESKAETAYEADESLQNGQSATRKHYGYKASDIRNAKKLDSITTNDDGEDLSDRISALATRYLEEELNDDDRMHHAATAVYLTCLMNHKNVPGAPLTVMYAHCLFLLERLVDPDTAERHIEENVSDTDDSFLHLYKAGKDAQKITKTSSVKWALKRLGDMTITELTEDSERSLHEHFDDSGTLRWSDRMRNKLLEPVCPPMPNLWGDLIFTDYYTESRMQHWATETHNATIIRAAEEIAKNPVLTEHVNTFLHKEGKLVNELKKHTNSEKKKTGKASADTRKERES